MLKYFEKKFFTFDDEKINQDIDTFEFVSGLPVERLSTSEMASLNRLLGDGTEYYTLKPSAQSIFKNT